MARSCTLRTQYRAVERSTGGGGPFQRGADLTIKVNPTRSVAVVHRHSARRTAARSAVTFCLDAREELQRRSVPGLRLIAVREVAGGREHHQLAAADPAVHDLHRFERRIAVTTD